MSVRLTRSETERVIAGVCGGLGEYLGVDPVFVRLTFVLLAFSGGIGIPLYLIMAIVVPSETDLDRTQSEVVEKNVDEFGNTVRSNVNRTRQHPNGPALAAILLILAGVSLLLQGLDIAFLSGPIFWALLLIGLGLYLVLRRSR